MLNLILNICKAIISVCAVIKLFNRTKTRSMYFK